MNATSAPPPGGLELAPGKYHEFPAAVPRRAPALAPLPQASIQIPERGIAARYCDEVLTVEQIEKFETTLEKIQKQRADVSRFSLVTHHRTIDDFSKVVADDPSAANLKKMRELRSLDDRDLNLMQQAAINRVAKLVREEISPAVPEIYVKVAAWLEADAALIEAVCRDDFQNFGIEAVEHALAQSLRANAALFRRLAQHAGNSGELTPLLESLIAAFRDPARPKPDLSLIKPFVKL